MSRVLAVTLSTLALTALSALEIRGAAIRIPNPESQIPAVAQQPDSVDVFVRRLEPIVQRADAMALIALLSSSASRNRAADFASTELLPGAAHVVVQERDRQALQGAPSGSGYRLMVDVFADFGGHARISTWRLDIARLGGAAGDREWAIQDEERISSVENVYRLALNTTKQFAARGLRLSSEDIDLTLADGSVFVSDIDSGTTALVLMGHGTMNFHPSPETERGQVKIFCGSEALDTGFGAAFIRINPVDFESLVAASQIQPVPVDSRELKRAQEVFRDESIKSFVIDLGDLSRDTWSLVPSGGDFIAEVRTRKYDSLTYAKSSSEAEDVTLFDRKRKHNIALYPSKEKLARRGAFYNEDDLLEYDILDYDVDISAYPDRQWIDGHAIMRVKVRSYGIGTMTIRLADPLTVQSIVSREYGRLFAVRVRNQNMVVVSLPTFVPKDTQMTLTINYSGRLEPQTPDRETVQAGQISEGDLPLMSAERNYLYSNRSFWYPQATVSDYASAKIRVTVPMTMECVASGQLDPGFPLPLDPKDGLPARKIYVFTASQPLRYLSFIVSRFARAETATIGFEKSALNISVEANPRQVARGHDLLDRAVDIAVFYDSILKDVPYSSFTIALVESDLPGGHSPGYFAALNQPLPTSPLVWRNDPAAFSGFPDFFIAHEMAHQWWGQAVGWRNYHEQWLSEGFAQYFAALYAQHERGDDLFASVLKHMRRWAIEKSDQGPVYLGYRLGHVRDESRIFRALVYNKGAMVLHMLRRLVGDEAFFNGLRRYYREMRFRKAGTEDFRAAMEAETGRKLDRFFDKWIYGSTLPKLRLAYNVEGTSLVVHVEQVGDLFDVPVTLTLQYADRKPVDLVVPVSERIVDRRFPIPAPPRSVDVNKDESSLADVTVGRWPPLAAHPPARTAQTPE
jgi:Peptidase family M1 domain